jgi:hypothetical protein
MGREFIARRPNPKLWTLSVLNSCNVLRNLVSGHKASRWITLIWAGDWDPQDVVGHRADRRARSSALFNSDGNNR